MAFSLFDTIKFTPQWELTGGMRYDHLDSSYYRSGPADAFQLLPGPMTWPVGAWRWSTSRCPYGSIYVGYGTSFNPSIQGVSDGASNDALAANTVNLPPEEDDSYEIGTKWDVLDEKLSLDRRALSAPDKTNARIIDPTQPGTVYTLSGKQRVQGVEFDAAGKHHPRLEDFRRLCLYDEPKS